MSGRPQTAVQAPPPEPPAPGRLQVTEQPAPSREVGQDQTISYHTGSTTGFEQCLVIISILCIIIFLPFSLLCVVTVVRQFERAVMFRNGKLHKTHPVGPGLIFRIPCVDEFRYTDLRTICYKVPPQEALTKDSLTISVDAVVFYRITDPVRAVIKVSDYKFFCFLGGFLYNRINSIVPIYSLPKYKCKKKVTEWIKSLSYNDTEDLLTVTGSSTHYLAATMLRNSIGTRKLTELLSNRPAVSLDVFTHMREALLDWGITAVKVEIKDIRLPLQLQKAMAAEAESSRLANAKIIVAKAEIEATKSLEKATTILMENPYCMQLRYLQSLHVIAATDTHTIVFPSSILPK